MDPRYLRTFRHCAYFGAFFCTGCHCGDRHILPASVVQRWDFREHPVSKYARSVIASLAANRLFDMEAMNPELVHRVAKLRRAGELRRRAATVFPYLQTCKTREDDGMADLIIRVESYELDLPYTLNELCSIKLGEFNRKLQTTLREAESHVLSCQRCEMRGHNCEGCRSSDVIFPFQRPEVMLCHGGCGACYHLVCYENIVKTGCGRCKRVMERRKARAERSDEY